MWSPDGFPEIEIEIELWYQSIGLFNIFQDFQHFAMLLTTTTLLQGSELIQRSKTNK